MQKQWFTVLLSFATIPAVALAGDGPGGVPSRLAAELPPVQPLSPPPPTGVEVTLPGGSLGGPTGADAGNPGSPWTCGPANCFWLRGEYLLWWTKAGQTPDLVTTGVPGANAGPGVLGQPGTTVLFGGSGSDQQARSGVRLSGGIWLNDSQTVGVEGGYFYLGSRSPRFDGATSGAAGSALIARPFFDVLTGSPNAELVGFPGLAAGEIHVSSSSRFQGGDFNFICTPCRTPCCDTCAGSSCGTGEAGHSDLRGNGCGNRGYWLSYFGGFRYLQLDESLGVTEVTRVSPALPAGSPLFGGSTITTTDQFDTRNSFYGPQIGARAEFCRGRLFVDVLGKIALGVTHEVVDIHGSTVITSPAGVSVVTPAGFLDTGSNSGRFTRDQFAVVPEVGVNVGYQLTPHLRGFVGYSFLYWSSVLRPGDQVDVGLSGTQLPTDSRYNPGAGPARPAVLLRETDYWAQGVNFGLELRY